MIDGQPVEPGVESIDPTRPSGGMMWLDDSLYMEDPASQGPLASLILEERFPDVSFRQVCRYSDNEPSERRHERWLFVDDAETGRFERAFYFVSFTAHQGGPVYGYRARREVTLMWTHTVAFRRPGDENIYHLPIPFPREDYQTLNGVRAEVLDNSIVEADIGDDIELSRLEPVGSFPWPADYVPKVIDEAHLRFRSLQFDETWQDAFPGDLLITWDQFLARYGTRTPNDWMSMLLDVMTYRQKFELVLRAIPRKDLIPRDALAMLGVGPVEDCLDDELMSALESLERETSDPEIRARLCETLAAMYVHGDPEEIQRRWKALVGRVATPEILDGLRSYFDRLA